MAACTELEIEEKSSEESSRSVVNSNDSTFYNVSSGTRYNAAWNANTQKELGTQLQVESETGDLKELSDDEFLHLLKEASTFNKPNNQESILLKQLRKEVAESDSCENVSRGETGPVTRVDRKCSKIVYGSSCSESSVSSHTSAVETVSSALPAQTFNRPVQRKSDNSCKDMVPVLLSVTEGSYVKCSQVSHIVEVETNNNQSSLKPGKIPENNSHLQSLRNCSDTKGQCGNNTSSAVHNSLICDFNKSSSDQTYINLNHSGRCFGGGQEEDRNETVSTNMVKLENENASSLAISDCEELVNEPITDRNRVANSSSIKEAQEVEMMEIRRPKDSDLKDRRNETSPANKQQVSSEMTNSKFYVNCNDVDTTVTFPLKLVSSGIDDRNTGGIICDAVNEQLKRQMNFPCFSWPRAQQVHSFLGSLPVDHEALQSQNDSDSAGNPFARGARAANITSFVSATLLDYPTTTLMTESQSSKLDYNHRKHKRTRNNPENCTFILAENIAGHRGNEDIDSLVKFIEAADKNDKVFTRGNNSSNQLLKNNSTQDVLNKRKINGKESKTNHSKNGSSLKKKLDDNSNHGNNKLDSLSFDSKALSSESESSDESTYSKVNKVMSPERTECGPYLDINSNVMDSVSNYSEMPIDKEVVNVVEEKLDLSSAKCVSPDTYVTADFHVTSETTPQPTEESGFRIVKKKQRKRHQGKRSENYRWHSAAARVRQSTSGDHDYYSKEQTQRGMLLSNIPLSQRNQCGKQDSRRKSTSSVPHSEQSSADNSDLDSVHSLPVRGSAPHPTKTHPHTTPSSSSSTPQASYADIARMPVSSVSKQNSVVTATQAPPLKFSSGADRREIHSEVVRSSCIDKNIDSSTPHSVRLNENGEPCVIKNSPASVKSTREINTQTEPFLSEESVQHKNDFIPASNLRKSSCVSISEENRNYQKCILNCKNKNCICSKSDRLVSSKQDSNDRLHRPAVVMMGNMPAMEDSDISFGIDLKEILQISAGESTDLDDSGVMLHTTCLSDAQHLEHQCDSHDVDQQPNTKLNKSSFGNCTVNKCDASEQVSTLKKSMSSPCSELRLASGQHLQFTEEIIDMQKFNYTEIVDLFSREWKNVQKEYNSEINKTGEKVKYYENSC